VKTDNFIARKTFLVTLEVKEGVLALEEVNFYALPLISLALN
jgi:hypothetical protein